MRLMPIEPIARSNDEITCKRHRRCRHFWNRCARINADVFMLFVIPLTLAYYLSLVLHCLLSLGVFSLFADVSIELKQIKRSREIEMHAMQRHSDQSLFSKYVDVFPIAATPSSNDCHISSTAPQSRQPFCRMSMGHGYARFGMWSVALARGPHSHTA